MQAIFKACRMFFGFFFFLVFSKHRGLLHHSPWKLSPFAPCQQYPPPGVKLEGAVSHGLFPLLPLKYGLASIRAALCEK